MRNNYRIIKYVLSLLVILNIFLMAASTLHVENAYAVSVGTDIKKGDIVKLQAGSWNEEYIVLDPINTNTGSKGMFLLQKKMKEKTAFYDSDDISENRWEGSTAQQWCTGYYNKLPESVRNAIIGVQTSEVESGGQYFLVNNIDGTRGGAKDKVFFLSVMEHRNYAIPAGVNQIDGIAEGKGHKWLLRAKGTDCSDVNAYIVVVQENGEEKDYGTSWEFFARPAYNLNLPDEVCAVKADEEGITQWNIDMNEPKHKAGNVSYTWAEDNSKCTAEAVCSNCGEVITEEAAATEEITTPATEEAEGVKTYTAVFANEIFTTQTKEETIPKKEAAAVQSGDKKVVNGSTYKVISAKSCTVALVKAKNVKSYTVPSSVKIENKSYKVVSVEGKSLKGSKLRTVTVGKNVTALKKYAFSKSKVTKVVLKTGLLKKSAVKGCLRGSKVKSIKVNAGSKSTNKKLVKAYKKIFTKSNAGRSVKVA